MNIFGDKNSDMKTITVTYFKDHLYEVLEQIKDGNTFIIISDSTEEIIGYFTPNYIEQPKRQLGILEGKAKVKFIDDFKIGEEDFLGCKI